MHSVEKISLIEGNFSDTEAKEILHNVITTKIQFHEMKNFSSKERFGKEDETSVKRIAELKKALAKTNELLKEASTNNLRLLITSSIIISTSEK